MAEKGVAHRSVGNCTLGLWGFQRTCESFAAGGAKVCGGRAKSLRRTVQTCYDLRRLLRQWEVMVGASYLLLLQYGIFTEAEVVEIALGRMVLQT